MDNPGGVYIKEGRSGLYNVQCYLRFPALVPASFSTHLYGSHGGRCFCRYSSNYGIFIHEITPYDTHLQVTAHPTKLHDISFLKIFAGCAGHTAIHEKRLLTAFRIFVLGKALRLLFKIDQNYHDSQQ